MLKIKRWSALLMVMGAVGGCARSDALHKTASSESDNIELTKVDYKLDNDVSTASIKKTATPLPAPADPVKTADKTPESETKTASIPASDTLSSITTPKSGRHSKPSNGKSKVTLSTLLNEMLVSNPDIAIAGAKEKEQWFGVKVAEAAKMPTVDVSSSAGPQRVFEPTPGGDAVRRDVTASVRQTLFDFGATSNDIKRAERSYASATNAKLAKAEAIAESVMEAYLDVKKADEMISVTKRNIEAHQKILDLVSMTAKNGSGTVADVKRITTRLESAKSDLIDLTTKRSDGADAFKNLTNTEFDRIDDAGYQKLFGKITGLDVAAIEINPVVQSINEEIESLKYQLASVKAGKLPVIALQGSVKASRNLNSPEASDEQVSTYAIATVRVPLYDGGLNDNQQGQIASRLEAAQLRLEKQKRDLLQQSENVKRLSDSGNNKTGSIEARVSAAKKVAELALEQFKTGGRTLFELLDAQSESFKSQSDLIQQSYERKKSMLVALQIKGKLVESILAISPPENGPVTNTVHVTVPTSGPQFNLPGVNLQ